MKPKILLVEDDENLVELVRYNLRADGFEVVSTSDGEEALLLAEEEQPDLVILDWMMPGLSGVETLKAMREHMDLHRLPIIMCTARDEERSIGVALEAGANDYVQKPIRMPVLLARISAQLMRQAAMSALGSVNQDLEALLAQRTRELFASRGKKD